MSTPLDPEMTAYVERYIARRVPAELWQVFGADVRRFVLAGHPTLEAAKTACSHVAAYARWAYLEGLPTSVEQLAEAETLERYIQVGMPGRSDRSRATRRAVLRRAGLRAVPPDCPPPEAIRYRFIRPPYEPEEVARYLALASSQPTRQRRRRALAVLCLGLGAGLDGRDLPWVTADDVTSSEDTVTVQICGGPRPRTVIALDVYAPLIQGCAEGRERGPLVGGSEAGQRNVTSTALARLISDPNLPQLVASRLRSTWLRTHLELGTPLTVLLPAAGLSTARPLEDLLPHVTPVAPSCAAAWLRGSDRPSGGR